MRKVLVRKDDGLVVNAIEIEEDANWKPTDRHYLLNKKNSDLCEIGDTWDGKKAIKPILPEPEETEPVLTKDELKKIRGLLAVRGANGYTIHY